MVIQSTRPPLQSRVAVLAAVACLLAGLDAALLLLGLPAPVRADRLAEVHGMLMVLGFVGTLVALERAIALGETWGYLAPAGLAVGGVALLTPLDLRAGKLALAVGAAGLLAVYARIWRRQACEALLAQAAGAVAAVGAALLWLGGVDVPALLPWLVAFAVLTIAGERLELARVVALTGRDVRVFLGAVTAVLCGAPCALLWPGPGTAATGLALLVLVGWLVEHDVARRTVRSTGLPRFMAACLLCGYAWLALAAGLWLVAGPASDGPRYDAVVHAVFLGFTMSMIMAHAPVILPAVLRRKLPYRPLLWGPAVLLQASLLVRFAGDARGAERGWQAGGALGVTAVLAFGACTAWVLVRGAGRARTAEPGRSTEAVR